MKVTKLTKFLPLYFLIIVLAARFHMALVRYFDVDEFAHMHWSWLVVQGKIIYKDFFFYNTPLFQWTLAPIFALPESPNLVIITRIFQLLIYIGVMFFLYRFTKKVTKSINIALLSLAIFSVFPMTFDKSIEIRPDMLMILFFLAGLNIALHVSKWNNKKVFILGALTSLSILTLPKIIFALPALVFLVFVRKPKKIHIVWGIIGFLIPATVYLIYLLATGSLNYAFISIVHDSVAVNQGKLPFSVWSALSPWPLIYVVRGGPSLPWYVNTGIWITAIPGLIFFTLKEKIYGLFLILFFVLGVTFVYIFPAPYTQYFLPLSVFASMLSAYLIYRIIRLLTKVFPHSNLLINLLVLALLGSSFFIQYRIRTGDSALNQEQMDVLAKVSKLVGRNETVYDMVGSFVYRPDGFEICCHPYGEFWHALRVKRPALRDSLVTNQTKFIILDRTGQVLWKPFTQDLNFIRNNYLEAEKYWKFYTVGVQFYCNNGNCVQHNLDNKPLSDIPVNSFSIIISESYKIEKNPRDSQLFIDSEEAISPITLGRGLHTFKVSDNLKYFSIQLDR